MFRRQSFRLRCPSSWVERPAWITRVGTTAPIRGDPLAKTSKRRRRTPRWALWTVVFGSLLLVAGGGGAIGLNATVAAATSSVGQESLLGSAKPAEEKKN